ncbi:hypothetical protein NE237_014015 [Protea cynaroides]|uniref:Uncharacterized protein n=1 Tax=Protea cynaroides TaxID=273540 RepID=A0A9Q0GZS3_9MAGN|nr:hypothetical protein NE237_014015 [Protea cynaroides]
MPFPLKIQPIDSNSSEGLVRNDPVKPVVKSRLKRLFERQFPSVLRISLADKPGVGEIQYNKDGSNDWEPSSVCLAKMVQNFIEESNEKQPASAAKCGRNRCNCFNGNCSDSSDDELDLFNGFGESVAAASSGDACEILKSLIPCASTTERNLLADTAKIVEKNKNCKLKDDCRKIVTDGLISLGYDASICKSHWEKSISYPAGEYEYIDVIVQGDRLLIDIEFRSEFEIARSTKNYRAVLQTLPSIFVGKPDRLQQIVYIVSDAAKQSLKKKGMHFPPWRKAEYMRSKWLSPHTRTLSVSCKSTESENEMASEKKASLITTKNFSGEFELNFGEKPLPSLSATDLDEDSSSAKGIFEEKIKVVVSEWQPPAVKPKSFRGGGKIVTVFQVLTTAARAISYAVWWSQNSEYHKICVTCVTRDNPPAWGRSLIPFYAKTTERRVLPFLRPSLHTVNEKPTRKRGLISSMLGWGKISKVARAGSSIDRTWTSIVAGLGEEAQGYDECE